MIAMQTSDLPHPRDARQAAGLSIRELADVSDTSPSTVLRCEASGQYPQRPRCRRRYLAALGLTDTKLHRRPSESGGTVPPSGSVASATSPDARQVPT